MSWALSIADANILISTNTKLFCIECDGHITLRQPHLSGFVGTGPFQGVLARGYPRFINAYNVKRQERSQSTPIPTLSSIHVPWLTHRPNLDKGGGTSSWRFWKWTCGLHPHHSLQSSIVSNLILSFLGPRKRSIKVLGISASAKNTKPDNVSRPLPRRI